MKRNLVSLLVAFSIWITATTPLRAETPPLVLLNGVTVTGISAVMPSGGFRKCFVRIRSAAGSTGIMLIKGSDANDSSNWQLLGTINSPDVNGEYWSGTCPAFIWVDVSTGPAGTITATLDRREPGGN